MSRRSIVAAGLAAITLHASATWAQKGVPPTSVIIGGRPMASDHDIMENLAQSGDHTMLVALIRAVGLDSTLQSHGPYTLFAPTDAAFSALPPAQLDTLRRPENKAKLLALLSMEVVPGIYSSARLHYLLRTGKGQTELDTVSGGKVTVATNGPTNLVVRDGRGNVADVTLYDAKQANGVIFVTDRVLQPAAE